jgi:transmembrane sensor
MQPFNHWQYLLQQYLNNRATDEERMQFFEVLQRNEVDWESMLVQLGLQEEQDPAYRHSDFTAMIEQIMQHRPVKRKVHVIRWWMAAAVLIFIVSGVWFLVGRTGSKPTTVAVTPDVQDIMPGTQGAVLTLADGRQIIIDSTGKGNITREGNMTVRRVGDQLVYETNKAGGQSAGTPTIAYNTLSTPRGRQFQLVLADGSRVWLNAASSIRYPVAFAANERWVEITGEAYLEVTQNASKPFRVSLPPTAEKHGATIEVLGTHFNVNSYADEPDVKTTLLEGKVKVNCQLANGEKAEEMVTAILQPGQQAVITGLTHDIPVKYTDVNAVVAWKNGVFNFQDAGVQQVMRQLARWYDVDVQFENGIPAIEFGGKMGRDLSLMNVLRFLEKSGLHCKLEGKRKLIVLQ